MTTANELTRRLAERFIYHVNRVLGSQLAEINRRNEDPFYIAIGACATQDFTDANELMLEALADIGAEDLDELANWGPTVDAAWSMARRAQFDLTRL